MLKPSGLCSQSSLRLFSKTGGPRMVPFRHTPSPTQQHGRGKGNGLDLYNHSSTSKRQTKSFSSKRGPMLYKQSHPSRSPESPNNKQPSRPSATDEVEDATTATDNKPPPPPPPPQKDDGPSNDDTPQPEATIKYSVTTMDELATQVHKISQDIRLRSVNELREVLSDRENKATISEVLTAAQLQARIEIKDELTRLKARTTPSLHWRLDQVMRTADSVHISQIPRVHNLPLLVLWHGAKFVLRRPILAALILAVLLTSSMFGSPIN